MGKYLNDIDYKNCVGQVCKSNSFGDFKILSYTDSETVDIEFIDTGSKVRCSSHNIRIGKIKDVLAPSISGVGVLGDVYSTFYTNEEGEKVRTFEYVAWVGMLRRCYDEKFHLRCTTYKDCTVSDNFKQYTYFYEWCKKQKGYKEQGFQLDKDLIFKGNKIYSEDTCLFIPKEINSAITKRDKSRGELPIGVYFSKVNRVFVSRLNVGEGRLKHLGCFQNAEEAFICYKKAKEDWLKSLAEKWKTSIDYRAYTALMEYIVDIGD